MLQLQLPDMTCGHCAATVTRTVQSLDPQARVQIDLPNHSVQIETRADEGQVRAALTEEGYAPAD
jgi:copper chaperone